MISYRAGNLLEQPDLTHIAHQANLYHVMGAGIAKAIADKWPRALGADQKTANGDTGKLGTFSLSHGKPTIVNVYSQDGMGKHSTDYLAMKKALDKLRSFLDGQCKLGIPHGMGCGLAGGDWAIVEKIIKDVFEPAEFECVIVKLEGKP